MAASLTAPWPLFPPREAESASLLVKRAMDLALGVPLLLLSLPVILVSAALVKLTSPGPAFFRQTRKGRGEESFEMIKLRTMVVGAEAEQREISSHSSGPIFTTVRDDPRVTRVGRLLRTLSIDELPQLLNVVRGEMSLVGPRPLMADEVPQLPPVHRCSRARAKPGLTCLWQINGRNDCSDAERLALDEHYLEEWSLWFDLKILARTIPAVVSGRGAE